MRYSVLILTIMLTSQAWAAQNDAMCGKDAPDSFSSACTLNYVGLFNAYMQSIVVAYDQKDIFKASAGSSFSYPLKQDCEYTITFSTTNQPAALNVTVFGPPGQTQLAYKSGTSGSLSFSTDKSGTYYFQFQLPAMGTGTHYNFNIQKGNCCYDNDYDGWTTCQGDCKDYDAGVNPGMAEKCDNFKDDNCNGQTDENCQCIPDCSSLECGGDDGCGSTCGECPPPVLSGDVNGSGGVSVSDLQCLVLAVKAPPDDPPACLKSAELGDINCDGSKDVVDIQLQVEMVLRYPDPGIPVGHDPDVDNIHTGCDNCPNVFNPYQVDKNGNQVGDICE